MKIQDMAFLILLVVLLYYWRPQWFAITGLLLLVLSMPLFYFWIFFTAQRFIYYGFAFLLIAVIFIILQKPKK